MVEIGFAHCLFNLLGDYTNPEFNLRKTNAANEEPVGRLESGRIVLGGSGQTDCIPILTASAMRWTILWLAAGFIDQTHCSRRFPLESFPDGEWGSAPFDPLAGDERRELCSVDIESKYSRPIFRTLEYSYYASPSFVKPP